jgi:hypothetical protein
MIYLLTTYYNTLLYIVKLLNYNKFLEAQILKSLSEETKKDGKEPLPEKNS